MVRESYSKTEVEAWISRHVELYYITTCSGTKPGSTTTESKSNAALDANSGDTPRVSAGGRQGVESVLIFIILKTVLRTRELDI